MIYSVADIARLFDEGVAKGAKHMIIVTAKDDHSEPPIYAEDHGTFMMQLIECRRDRDDISVDIFYLEKSKVAQVFRSRPSRKLRDAMFNRV